MKKKVPANAQIQSYVVGYRKPPMNHQFRKGESGNPSGRRDRPVAPNLKAHLQGALNQTVTIRRGRHQRTYTKGAAGIEQLVDQWAKGDRNARRDLMLLCDKFGVDLTNRETLQSAVEEALSAEDEALLADFVKRHGGQYPPGADTVPGLPATDVNLLSSPTEAAKLLAPPSENLINSSILQTEEKSHE